MMKTARARALTAAATAALLLSVTGCSTMGGDSASEPATTPPGTAEGGDEGEVGGTVVLVTHSSFSLPQKLVRSFESETGIDLETRSAGDGGTLTARLSLTKDDPTGDVAFGVDNTFASRPLDEGVFAPYAAELPAGAEQYALADGEDRLTPVDVAHVCVNVDTTWFDREGIEPPRTLEDLADPAYEGLFVTPGAATSSPGMAFLLAGVAAFGDSWRDYWTQLLDNGTKVVDGWEDAYYGDFTQGGGGGERPIVLSYDSSPAFTVTGGRSTTAALLDTCFRQVEYAGVLEGAANPAGAEAVVDWLLSDEVQAALPTSMYVFPVSDAVEVPTDWAQYAEQPTDPYVVDPGEIAAHREQWLTEWTDVISR